MKHKKFLLITLICLIGIGISFLLFSAHRPFKDLEAADITSASVRLSPPDTTIQIVETLLGGQVSGGRGHHDFRVAQPLRIQWYQDFQRRGL